MQLLLRQIPEMSFIAFGDTEPQNAQEAAGGIDAGNHKARATSSRNAIIHMMQSDRENQHLLPHLNT